MTRKDYIIIAEVFKRMLASPDTACAGPVAVQRTAESLATELYYDNPRFDRSKFLAACGVTTA